MRIDGISRIDALESAIEMRQRGSLPNPETVNGVGPAASSAIDLPGKHPDQRPSEVYIASRAYLPGTDGLRETYAKFRYDQDTNMVMIQIVNAVNDEVIAEIPPGAWVKLRQNGELPRGVIVEEER